MRGFIANLLGRFNKDELLWQPDPKWCSACGVRVCFDFWFSGRGDVAAQKLDAEKLYADFATCSACGGGNHLG